MTDNKCKKNYIYVSIKDEGYMTDVTRKKAVKMKKGYFGRGHFGEGHRKGTFW